MDRVGVMMKQLSRRDFLKAGGIALLSTAGVAAFSKVQQTADAAPIMQMDHHNADAMAMPVGEVDHQRNGFNPSDILTDFDYGTVSTLPGGRTLREYDIFVTNKDIEVVPGIAYPAWTYNGRIRGPTIRATEGDLLRIHLHNDSSHPHSLHFHGVHPAEMD